MTRRNRVLVVTLSIAVAACGGAPVRWEKPGVANAGADEAECRAAAHEEAARRLPYGNGPPILFYPKVSMLQWTQAIDNQRSYVEARLTQACMREKGFALVPAR
jgi:hypothetical protein